MYNVKSVNDYPNLRYLEKFIPTGNGMVAGGCFKDIFTGVKVKDYDIFFRNEKEFDDCVTAYNGMEDWFYYYDSDNVVAYKNKNSGDVVELNRKVFGDAEEVLNNFDFTVTKFAFNLIKEDIKVDNQITKLESSSLVIHNNFFEHLFNRRLVVDKNIQYPMSTFNRIFKYSEKGFYPCREIKLKIAKAINLLNPSDIDVDENFYRGID